MQSGKNMETETTDNKDDEDDSEVGDEKLN